MEQMKKKTQTFQIDRTICMTQTCEKQNVIEIGNNVVFNRYFIFQWFEKQKHDEMKNDNQ